MRGGQLTTYVAELFFLFVGRSCSEVVEHAPRDSEVAGLNPTRCWAFSSSLLSSLTLNDTEYHIRYLKEMHLLCNDVKVNKNA